MPRIGRIWPASRRAAESSVPSPPSTTTRSAEAGSPRRAPLPRLRAVSGSNRTSSPRASTRRATRRTAGRAAGLPRLPTIRTFLIRRGFGLSLIDDASQEFGQVRRVRRRARNEMQEELAVPLGAGDGGRAAAPNREPERRRRGGDGFQGRAVQARLAHDASAADVA